MNTHIRQVLGLVSGPGSNRIGLQAMRLAIAVIFLWIGALKFVPYEAESITPFVANSPAMSFFYAHPDQYAQHLTHEGELKLAERTWQAANHTYAFSRGLGTVELLIGVLVLVGMGDAQHGFPYLSGAGRLVLKDVTLMAGAWLVLADSVRAVLDHDARRLPAAAGFSLARKAA